MWRMVAGGNRPWELPHPVPVELRPHALIGTTEDPMLSACERGKTKFPPPLLEAIDCRLRLRETERIQDSCELLEALHAAGGQSPSVVSIEIAEPLSENAVRARKESASRLLPPVPESRSRWRTLEWMVLSILACCRERRVHPGQAPLNWFRSGRADSRASTARPIWPSAKCTGSIGFARICDGR